jgi:hypothetical protein
MNTEPNALLMRVYETEDVYLDKQAGLAPRPSFFGPIPAAVTNWYLARQYQEHQKEKRQKAVLMNELIRERNREEMRDVDQNLEYSQVPYSSMVRLASIASEIGEDLAKEAGIGDLASFSKNILSAGKSALQTGAKALQGGASKALGALTPAAPSAAQGFLNRAGLSPSSLKWKIPLAAGAAGAGYLAMKGGQGAMNYMSQEAHPQSYGTGPRLNYGVNQYGQPQVGSPFSG